MSNIKNFYEQGGEKWIIKGELELTDGGRLLFNGQELKPAKIQINSEATTIAELKEDFNNLLEKLKVAGLMKND